LEPVTPDDVKDKDSTPHKKPRGYLHVLALQPAKARSGAKYDADEALAVLKDQLALAEKFLTGQTSYADQRAYKGCGDAKRDDVYYFLVNQATQVKEKADDNIRIMHEERIDIFNAAEDIFKLFFPTTFDGPTTSKYWGAVKMFLKVPAAAKSW
jgi:hypothetical protein